jgi:hypothetical protein
MQKKSVPTKKSRQRDQALFIRLCKEIDQAESQAEQRFWCDQLNNALLKSFARNQGVHIETTMAQLDQSDENLGDILLERAMDISESETIEIDGRAWEVVLILAPMIVWTRYQLPHVRIDADRAKDISAALKRSVLVPQARIAMQSAMVDMAGLPNGYANIWKAMHALGSAAINGLELIEAPRGDSPMPFVFADTRYVVLAAAVPKGEALFCWQADLETSREASLDAWRDSMTTRLAQDMPGCQLELMLPCAYHSGFEQAEKRIRPITIRASCEWLIQTLDLPKGALKATIVTVQTSIERQYRIGYSVGHRADVIYGTIWHAFEQSIADTGEELESDALQDIEEIVAVLKESGVGEVRHIPGTYETADCDGCGAPLFPDPRGELTHIELPERILDAPAHFH